MCIDRCIPLPVNIINLILQEYRILHQSADRKYSRILTFEEWDCVKVYLCPLLPDVRSNVVLYEGFEVSPSCPFDMSSIKMDMDVEH